MDQDALRRWEIDRLPHPYGHREAWHALLDGLVEYPHDREWWPWRARKRVDRARPLATVSLGTSAGHDSLYAIPRRIAIRRHAGIESLDLNGEWDDAARVAALLFTRRTRAHLLILTRGVERDLNALLRWYGRAWVEAGYTLTPLVAGWDLRAIVVRRGRNKWVLCDLEVVTGSSINAVVSDPELALVTPSHGDLELDRAWRFANRLQVLSLTELRTNLRMTLGTTAIAVASAWLPRDVALSRPPPDLVAMARVGYGYRGGHVHGTPYRGLCYHADVRRLYAACLRSPLPRAWAMGHASDLDDGRPGLMMATVSGTSPIPIVLGQYQASSGGWVRETWTPGMRPCVLPTSEIPGLRSLGLTVEPAWGMVATDTFSLSALVDRLERCVGFYGASSAMGRYVKVVANALYGKWGSSPQRENVAWSVEAPHPDAFPMVTVDGTELADLWTWDTVRYTPTQQVGHAALITGQARSVLYAEISRRLAEGRRVVHAHTDGYVATGLPPVDMPTDTTTIGAWRMVQADADGIVLRGGGYVLGDAIKWSGAPGWGRRDLEVAWDRGQWIVRGEVVTRRADAPTA